MSQAHTTGKVLAGTVGAVGLLFATAQAANAATVTVKQNDTVWSLAQEHGVSVKSIETLNKVKALDTNTDLIFVGQKLQVSQNSKSSQSKKGTYTIKAGDTLWDLADEYGTSVHTLQTLNHMSGDVIVTGEQLVLPSDAKPAKSTTAKAATSTTSNKVVAEDAAANTVTAASSTSSAKPTRTTGATAPSQATSASSTSQASNKASVSSQTTATSSSTTSVSQASTSQSSQSTAPTTAKRSRIVVGVQKSAATSSSSTTTTSASSSTATSTAAQSSTSTTSAAAQSTAPASASSTSQAAQSSTTSAAAKSSSTSQASSTRSTSTAAATPTSASTTQTAVKRTARRATVKRAATTASSTTTQSSAATVQSSASQSSTATPKPTTQRQTTVAKTQSSSAKRTANTANLSSGSVTGLAMKLASANIPYVYGGSSLSGMDCSGLVAYVYQHAAGISLPHSTTAQEAYVSVHSVKDAQPGDILFWGSRGGTYHDAIYLGNNQYVAAPTEGQNVEVQTISSYFAPSFAGTVK
ncbi:LysM peptidoglycan-binding domain-containing protein [Lactiplantibacillus dongliensis]|uniref:LysM peptidoglycan-binding domain-containing protein n=1 Tax=Lactiplantibacillus dongliensis TaxID=2559919 RepID=A0ABW1R588_9LACO|nr:LysM peptidoglycan-binding domain-containing protein [Lactiplantibacillus dongliensis]